VLHNPQEEMANLYAQTLGVFRLIESARAINIPSQKDKALAAFLCANHARSFRREYLSDLLWPRASEAKAKHSLSQALYAIRRRAPGLLIVRDGVITSTAKTDIDRFKELIAGGSITTASELITGPFLDCLIVDDAPEFDDWRDSFGRKLYLQLEQHLVSSIRHLPRIQQHRIIAGLPIGFQNWMPELEQFVHSLPSPAKIGLSESEAPACATSDASALSPNAPPLVGRNKQIEQILEAFSKSIQGEGQFLVVTGDAGFGKTRLLRESVIRMQGNAAHVIQAACYEPERSVALGPLIAALKERVDGAVLDQLEPIWANALGEVLPLPGEKRAALPTLSASAAQTRLFEAFLRLFEVLSRSNPIVIAIDDVQWCDRSTRALLSYLSHRAAHLKLFVVATLRAHQDANVSQPWGSWIRLTVDELTREDLRELVAYVSAVRGSEILTVNKLSQLTAGHPYLVTQVLGSATSTASARSQVSQFRNASQSIGAFVDSMFYRLRVSSQRVLAILAVLGRPAPVGLIRRIAKKHNVEHALTELISRGIVDITRNQVRFRHDIVREAAYARLPLLTRVEIHRQTAVVMQHKKEWAGQTATHYYRARLRRRAYRFALRAVRDADKRAAVYESVHYLELARRARPERDAFIRPLLAKRLSRIHRLARARAIIKPLIAANVVNPKKLRNVRMLDLEMAFALGIDGESLRKEIDAVERQLTATETDLLLRAVTLRLRLALRDGYKALISPSIQQLRELSIPRLHTNAGIESYATAVKAHCLTRSSSEAEGWAQELVLRCDDIEDHELRIHVLGVVGLVAYDSGHLSKADALHRRALAEIHEVGAINTWPLTASNHHMLLLELGKFDEAALLSTEINRRASVMDTPQTLAVTAANDASMLYEVRRFSEAKAAVNKGLESDKRSNFVWVKLVLYGTAGLIAIEEGQLDRASELAEFGQTQIARMGFRVFDVSQMEILIARVASIRQKRAEAIERLQTAILEYHDRDLMCRVKMRLELARLLRPVDRSRARQEAADVFRIATAMGARPLAERADSFLHGTPS